MSSLKMRRDELQSSSCLGEIWNVVVPRQDEAMAVSKSVTSETTGSSTDETTTIRQPSASGSKRSPAQDPTPKSISTTTATVTTTATATSTSHSRTPSSTSVAHVPPSSSSPSSASHRPSSSSSGSTSPPPPLSSSHSSSADPTSPTDPITSLGPTSSSSLTPISTPTLTPTSTSETTTTSSSASQILFTSTFFTTSTGHGGRVTTISTVTSSGMLNTNVPTNNSTSFSHNAGAIAGTVVGALIALGFAGLWVFLALRRRKQSLERELYASSEQVNISPEGGWRPPLEDDDYDPARYANILAQLGVTSTMDVGGGGDGEGGYGGGNGDERPGSAGTASVYSGVSAPASSRSLGNHSFMTGFGQAAETMRDDNAAMIPTMVMADGAQQPGSRRRTLSGGLDPGSWFAGRDMGDFNPTLQDGPSLSRESSSQGPSSANGKDVGSKNASFEDNIFTNHPTRSSSSQLLASSSSDVGSSNGPRRSGEGKRQSVTQKKPTPPTSYSFRRKSGSESPSLKDILGRLRGARGSSPGPVVPDVVVQVAPPSPSAPPLVTRFSDPHPHIPSSPYGSVIPKRAPTPPSSLLRPLSPGTANFSNGRPTLLAPENGDRLWPPVTLPPGPSPAVSDDSHEVTTHGLLDPQLPWRLGQTRADSTASLRDHEDYSRPIGKLFVHNAEHSSTTLDVQETTG